MLARKYSEQHIPKTSILAQYGEFMPDFIREHLKKQTPELEYAADLAMLDIAWHGSYFAIDEIPPTAELVESWLDNIEAKKFDLAASVRLVQSNWAVAEVWPELKNGLLNENRVVEQKQEFTILWRDEGQIYHRVLSVPEWTFISNIQQDNTLLESAEAALTTGELDISTVFSQLLSNNLLKEKITSCN
jgi:hypothetical protein